MKVTLYLSVKVVVETTLSDLENVIDELQENANYTVGSTLNVAVVETEIIELSTQYKH